MPSRCVGSLNDCDTGRSLCFGGGDLTKNGVSCLASSHPAFSFRENHTERKGSLDQRSSSQFPRLAARPPSALAKMILTPDLSHQPTLLTPAIHLRRPQVPKNTRIGSLCTPLGPQSVKVRTLTTTPCCLCQRLLARTGICISLAHTIIDWADLPQQAVSEQNTCHCRACTPYDLDLMHGYILSQATISTFCLVPA